MLSTQSAEMGILTTERGTDYNNSGFIWQARCLLYLSVVLGEEFFFIFNVKSRTSGEMYHAGSFCQIASEEHDILLGT